MIRKNNFVITILYWLWLQKVEPVSSHIGNVSNEREYESNVNIIAQIMWPLTTTNHPMKITH